LLRTAGGDGDELAAHVDLVGEQVGNTCIGRLHHKLHLARVIEQAFGHDAADVDIKTLQLAIRSLEVPRRIGTACTHDQVPTLEHIIELAVRRLHDACEGSRCGEEKNTRFKHGRSVMHDKHSRSCVFRYTGT